MKSLTRVLLATSALLMSGTAYAQDLTIWGLQAFNEAADQYIADTVKAFGAERGINAEYVVVPANVLNERLAAAFEGGSPPDVFMQVGGQAQYYPSLGLTLPIPEILEEMRAKEGGIYEGMVSQVMYNGEVHGVPLEVDVVPMYARRDLLEAQGLGIPTTWEELRSASQKILAADRTITPFAMPTSTANDADGQIKQVVWSFGGAMFAEDGKTVTWNSTETKAAYQFLADMFAEGTIPRSTLTWDDAGNNTAYQTGRAAFTINPPSIYSWMVANDEELLKNTELIAVPKGPGEAGRSGSSAGSWVWIVAKATDRPDDAKAWLSYFFDTARYEKLIDTVGGRWVPIYPALTASMPLFKDTPAFANFNEMAGNGIVDGFKGPPSALNAEVSVAKIVSQSFQKVVVDGMSVDDAVAWAQAEVEKLAAKY
ncbi:MAG: ABC transporter substrate-binding protein [Devosia sp.]